MVLAGPVAVMSSNALSRNPVGEDSNFDREESGAAIDTVCTVRMISRQIYPVDPGVINKELARDPVMSMVIRNTKDGRPSDRENGKIDKSEKFLYGVNIFRKLQESLSTTKGCVFHGSRLVIPERLQPQVLDITTPMLCWDTTDEATSTHRSVLAWN